MKLSGNLVSLIISGLPKTIKRTLKIKNDEK
jgi:hypothetical protein